MAKILITGGTGLIGTQLTKILTELKHDVAILSRNPKEKNQFKWNIEEKYIDEEVFDDLDYIIHLAGAGIADRRWTKKRKQLILDSRVKGTELLYNKVIKLNVPLKKFISASGIGYYGAITTESIFKENAPAYSDFVAKVCVSWEKAAQKFETLNIPQTIFRTGVVLGKKKSALQKMNTPLFLASIGSGKQYFSFIHIDDICNMYVKAVEEDNFTGIYNAVSPEQHNIDSFTNILSKITKKPIAPINVPAFILKIVLGEMSNILLKGSKVCTDKIQSKYHFEFPNLETALIDILK